MYFVLFASVSNWFSLAPELVKAEPVLINQISILARYGYLLSRV